jgi:sialate O-acetylesterase
MKKISNKLLIFFLLIIFDINAEVTLPAFFSDNMLLQQNSQVNIWGKTDANKSITVKTSWSKKVLKTTSDKSGRWKITFETPQSDGKPQSITISDGKSLTLKNILLGELWFCSGQSNMEMPMKGFKNQPVEGSNMDILYSKNDHIRLFTVKRNASLSPLTDVSGLWQAASPETVKEFSATAYYFGRLLNRILNVPIGLIHSSWGGSSAEAWMSEDMLKAFPEVKIPKTEEGLKDKNRIPTMLYNAMIHPFLEMTIKGILWYQGESNYDRANSYKHLFSTLVKGWREKWKLNDTIPFFYCQIAPYDYSLVTPKGKEVINSAYLREAQLKAEKIIPNSGMAVLMDAGQKDCIHPSKKQVAGERLALLALTKTYAVKGIVAESPVYKSIEIHNDTVQISFDRSEMWITAKNGESKLVTIAGNDGVFYPAKAWIVRSKLYAKSDQVKLPVAVRYAFDNYAEGDLFGTEGLPVSSFRSDDW